MSRKTDQLWELVKSVWESGESNADFVSKCNDYWAGKLHKNYILFTDQNRTAFNIVKPLVETKLDAVMDSQFTLEVVPVVNTFSSLQSLDEHQAIADVYNDELQNIFSVKLKSTRELFGVDENGEPLIDLERAANELPAYLSNDVVLNKCYRNPGEILICAHALGFGIYGETIVQMLDDRDHWKDVGYEVVQGDFVEGSETIIERPKENR